MIIRHSCDNVVCVNPDHLLSGTPNDNIQDSVKRNRRAKGDKHGLRIHPERAPIGDRNASRKYPYIRKGILNGKLKTK